ncbi:MAG: hypothetical protein Q7R41_12720 [Phycisphaerales bacterium]|nr:hypothetical protein [Phycisphaerales bacterium]
MHPRTTGFALVLMAACFALAPGCKHESAAGPATAEKPRDDTRELIDRLDQAGFYRYCETPDAAAQAKRAALEGRLPIAESVRRTCPMNTEKLARGGAADFMRSCKSVFGVHGVKLNKIEQMFVITIGYYVQIDGEEYEIYAEGDTHGLRLVDLNARGTLTMCNEILRRAGSDERMYMLDAGHEAQAVFLTEEQFRILRDGAPPGCENLKPPDAIGKG